MLEIMKIFQRLSLLYGKLKINIKTEYKSSI